jgi:energy-coupling factor transporter ATP-binding protein EcfA2
MPSRWWKSDLQIATPAWKFSFPSNRTYDLAREEGRVQFADDYVAAAKAKGIEILAICDHNSHEWIDKMKEAGARNGVVIFPGCEVTTGSGADGVHLLVLGDPSKTGREIDLLLASNLGFDGNTPRFTSDSGGNRRPNVSSRTVQQILDDLPEGYLVMAPHAFNDNGIAAPGTVKGSVRWSALHHPRLAAIDPGDCTNPTSDTFADRFRRRELNDYPCTKDLAFIATSDAYSFDRVGQSFTWIRMETPTLEALRQSCLDHEARLLCYWDKRLHDFPDHNPNNVTHGWIDEVSLGGVLANSSSGITVKLHHGLNVLIGGRGSGKSTVIAALRTLYAGTSSLPEKTKLETEDFISKTFQDARITSKHRLPVSQELQYAAWSLPSGSITTGGDERTFPTAFRVRVISQKELFERVAGDVTKRFSASRSLLGLIDESLELIITEASAAGTWARTFLEAQRQWAELAVLRSQLVADVAQLPGLRARIKELEGQVAAFASPETKVRLSHYRTRKQEIDELEKVRVRVVNLIATVETAASTLRLLDQTSTPLSLGEHQQQYGVLLEALEIVLTDYRSSIALANRQSRESLSSWSEAVVETDWHRDFKSAEAFFGQYTAELQAQGIDSNAIANIERELQEKVRQLGLAEAKVTELESTEELLNTAWETILESGANRRNSRGALFTTVEARSGRLRFQLSPYRDTVGWVDRVRGLLNLRSDAFIDDVPQLADWIWNQSEEVRNARWSLWRQSLIEGNFESIQQQSRVRSSWFQRLSGTDQTIRLRVAVEIPDDVATMKFMKDGTLGDKESDWQAITEGSPGQRTAAMLGLVLHYGTEPLVLDQPEDDLDSEWITSLLVKELRASRWDRQIIVASHNANVPVNGDAESVVALENSDGALRVRATKVREKDIETEHAHIGPIENASVRRDIQNIMEGGVAAFMRREQRYNNEIRQQRE